MPGPPPKPVEVKRRNGNPGKQRLPQPVILLPPAVGDAPDPPRGLKRHGKEIWRRLWGVGKPWLSPVTDWEIMVRLCQAYDERDELRREVRNVGRYSHGSTGQVVTHPAVDQLRTLEGLITRWESLCGFTPTDRSRLGMAEVQRASKLEAFLSAQANRG